MKSSNQPPDSKSLVRITISDLIRRAISLLKQGYTNEAIFKDFFRTSLEEFSPKACILLGQIICLYRMSPVDRIGFKNLINRSSRECVLAMFLIDRSEVKEEFSDENETKFGERTIFFRFSSQTFVGGFSQQDLAFWRDQTSWKYRTS